MRVDNWPAVLDTTIKSYENVKFSWAKDNCVFFAANIIKEITGVDFAAGYRSKSRTKAAAIKTVTDAVGEYDVEKFVEMLASQYFTEKPVAFAQRGDLVLVKTELGPAAAVVGMAGKVVAVGKAGLVRLPLTEAYRAWGTG